MRAFHWIFVAAGQVTTENIEDRNIDVSLSSCLIFNSNNAVCIRMAGGRRMADKSISLSKYILLQEKLVSPTLASLLFLHTV